MHIAKAAATDRARLHAEPSGRFLGQKTIYDQFPNIRLFERVFIAFQLVDIQLLLIDDRLRKGLIEFGPRFLGKIGHGAPFP